MIHVRGKDGCPESARDELLDFGQRLGKAERVDPEITETHARTARRASAHCRSIVGWLQRVKSLAIASTSLDDLHLG